MTQPPLFDAEEGKRRRDEALGILSSHGYTRAGFKVAATRCFERGFVTADDVRAEIGDPPSQGPMGAIFNNGYFYRMGNTHTKVPKGNARVIGKWMLTPKGRRELRYLDPGV